MNLEILRWWSTRENRPARRSVHGHGIKVARISSSPLHSTPLHSGKELVGRRGSPFVPSAGNERRTTLESRERERGWKWTDRTFPGSGGCDVVPAVVQREKRERERVPLRFSVTARNEGATKL